MIHDDHIHKPLTLFTPLTHFAEVRRASLHLLEKLGGVRVLKGSSGQQLVNEGKASMFGCLPDPLWLVGTASLRRYVWHSWNAGNVQGGAMLQLSWLSFPDRLSVATFVSLLGLGQADFSSHSHDLYHSGDKTTTAHHTWTLRITDRVRLALGIDKDTLRNNICQVFFAEINQSGFSNKASQVFLDHKKKHLSLRKFKAFPQVNILQHPSTDNSPLGETVLSVALVAWWSMEGSYRGADGHLWMLKDFKISLDWVIGWLIYTLILIEKLIHW